MGLITLKKCFQKRMMICLKKPVSIRFLSGEYVFHTRLDIRQKLYELKAQYEQNQLDNILDKRYINSLKKKLKNIAFNFTH
jgi:hypothetical protein